MLALRVVGAGSRLMSVLCAVMVVTSQCLPVAAQSAGGEAVSLPSNMNLRSIRRAAEAPESLASPVTIMNGGKGKEVTAGMALTAAQALALGQVLRDGVQSVILNGRGRAVGGTVDLTSVSNISSLVVPKGVTVFRDFGTTAPLELTGNLVNNGAIYALSTNVAVHNAIVSANNIRNSSGALITSILPQGGLAGIANAISNLSLSLIATDSIMNEGTISSANHLNLVAGNQIVNAAQAGVAAMSALGTVNIATQSLVNAGVMQSGNNINIAEQVIRNAALSALSTQLSQAQGAFSTLSQLHNLFVNNTGGVLQALAGAINFDHANAVKGMSAAVVGGDLLSPEVNVDAGAGHFLMNVGDVPGTLNVNAGSAAMGAATPNLVLGTMNISGDPTWFNSAGDISLTQDLEFAEDITLMARGNIDLVGFTVRSRVDAENSPAFDITIVAGAAITTTGNPLPDSVENPDNSNSIDAGQTVKVTGPAGAGGGIMCDGCTIDSSGGTTASPGGRIFLAAYQATEDGLLPGQGEISLTNAEVLSDGSGNQAAGDITMIAPVAIRLTSTDISMQGFSGNPKLTITAAQPKGALTADSFGTVKGSLKPGTIPGGTSLGQITFVNGCMITVPSGIVKIAAASHLELGDEVGLPTDVQSNMQIDVSGVIPIAENGLAGREGGSITLSSDHGDIAFDVQLSAGGGTGNDGTPGLAGVNGGTGGAGGAGGVIMISTPGTAAIETGDSLFINVKGGQGGSGGEGDDGDIGLFTGTAGGNGGVGGRGGTINLSANSISTPQGSADVMGGFGGSGGSGGNGFQNFGATPGHGGSGGLGGAAGKVTIAGTSGVSAPNVTAFGGSGGNGGDGGDASVNDVGPGAAGAVGGGGGAGGRGGTIVVGSGEGNVTLSTAAAMGGAGGENADGGDGNDGTGSGGNGGSMLPAGAGGAAGKVTVSARGSVGFDAILINGGPGGDAAGNGGNAGGATTGNVGGRGGDASTGGAGGKGGTVTVTSKTSNITDAGSGSVAIIADGGPGGDIGSGSPNTGNGGNGGFANGVDGISGNGGNGAIGGAGAAAGKIKLTAKAGNFSPTTNTSGMSVLGGSGGRTIAPGVVGKGGTGGASDSGDVGGNGGNSGKGGAGGKGGSISISARSLSNAGSFVAFGGFGGGGTLVGGTGGESPDAAGAADGQASAGKGGAQLSAGAGGAGGKVTLKATAGNIVGDTVAVTGGFGGDLNDAGGGGTGGAGQDNVVGGLGGAGGAGGLAGKAGKVSISAPSGTVTLGGGVQAIGGSGGDGGDGGTGGTSGGTGGNGGNAGNGGNGGKGGTISVKSTGVDPTSAVTGGAGGLAGDQGAGGDGTRDGDPGATGTAGVQGANGKVSHSREDIFVDDIMRRRLKRRPSRDHETEIARRSPRTDAEGDPYRQVSFVLPLLRLTGKEIPARNVLLAPDRTAIAHAGSAEVRVKQGAVAFIVNNGRDVTILSLHDGATGDVVVAIGRQRIELLAGEQLVITDSQTLTFADVNPVAGVACRDVREHALDNGQRAFVSQFSLASAMENIGTLADLGRSHDSEDRAVYRKTLKNAAILHMVTARKGPYKTWSKPAVTAKAI